MNGQCCNIHCEICSTQTWLIGGTVIYTTGLCTLRAVLEVAAFDVCPSLSGAAALLLLLLRPLSVLYCPPCHLVTNQHMFIKNVHALTSLVFWSFDGGV